MDKQRSGLNDLSSRAILVDDEYYKTEAKSGKPLLKLRLGGSKEYYTWWSATFLEYAKKAKIEEFFKEDQVGQPAFRQPASLRRPDIAALKPRDIMAGESIASYKAYYDAACKHVASIDHEDKAAWRKHLLFMSRYRSALRIIKALVEWPLLDKIISEDRGTTTKSIWRGLQVHFNETKPMTREDAEANIKAAFNREFNFSTSA